MASLTPCASAIVRVLQCVAAGGLVCSVASTTARILASAMRGMRPGRGASFSRPAKREAPETARARVAPSGARYSQRLRDILAQGTPSAASWTIWARWTTRAGKVRLRAQVSKIECSSVVREIDGAILLMNRHHSPSAINK